MRAISIHAPPRGATRLNHEHSHPKNFNSRPSARGDGLVEGQRALIGDFNSRPSARGDAGLQSVTPHGAISIHAPPRGATFRLFTRFRAAIISIHAPPRGATRFFQRILRWLKNFNSRPSARGDVFRITSDARDIFQFTPLREGRRAMTRIGAGLWGQFQFTPLREGRHACAAAFRRAEYFNSRPSARGDLLCRWHGQGQHISIHAPPRGATSNEMRKLQTNLISIHAPPRGATMPGGYTPGRPFIFQFTPLREGRQSRR